ncbi:MAG: outer membrane beta-barrel domain-containing protein [Deltaproteobacteria bacterium]|nr:outer membrane beta-barrel domain-containing protein [Deltaproteobacteria bacterium]
MKLKTLAISLLLPWTALGASPVPALLPSYDALAEGDEDSDEDDGGDILDDILNEGKKEESVEQERRAVRQGDLDDRVGVQSEALLPEEQLAEKRLIKILQKKTFMKIGRYEASPHVGFVTNDPFINRYLIGGAFAYHITELFAVEGWATFSPDFGEADWKPITHQLVHENKVTPDISKVIFFTNANLQYTPIYGKLAVLGGQVINFDVFGVFGTGIVHTEDDLDALQAVGEEDAELTKSQNHPTTNIGGGFRIIFNENLAFRLEGRSMAYVETIRSTTLEMKNNFFLAGSVSFFFPPMD